MLEGRVCGLENNRSYEIWREKKLSAYPASAADLLVHVSRLSSATEKECQNILDICKTYNMAVYQTDEKMVDTAVFRTFAENFGLFRIDYHMCAEVDGVSELTISDNVIKEEFIPYSDRPIGWHTDGYYKPKDKQIKGLMLHCVQPAMEGGVNTLMDHEIAYILLRDKNPAFISALMAPDCMTIPAYSMKGVEYRQESVGPVFAVEPVSGRLHMRFTMRKHNIIWKDDPMVSAAIAYLTEIFSADDSPVFTHKLEAGQGVVTNNVLHLRTGFTDDPDNRRLLYRARFYDGISDTLTR